MRPTPVFKTLAPSGNFRAKSAALTTAGLDEFVRLYAALRARGYDGDARVIERSDLGRFEPALHERVADIDSVDLRFDDRIYVTPTKSVKPVPKKRTP